MSERHIWMAIINRDLQCERQNSAVRKLQPLQTWMLLLDAGLWSGFQRQMELSEGFEKTVVTVR